MSVATPLLFDGMTRADVVAWIEAAARGDGRVEPGDVSPWDAFYRAYRSCGQRARHRVDEAFRVCAASPDVDVRSAVVQHWIVAPPAEGIPALAQLLADHAELYADQRGSGASRTLRGEILDAITARAEGKLAALARDVVLRHAVGAGVLSGRIGTLFGELGPDAVEALARAAAPDALEAAIFEAGYELHRKPARWVRGQELARGWPPPLEAALERGAASHRARFGGP